MKIKCSYCGAFFDDTMTECPHCGALNEGVVRTVSKQPLTVEELAEWYRDRGLPPYETTRFFIGVNYEGPRAFGIYKDEHSGNYVVYKNKDSGQRAVRYEGTDEAYAVNELYQRLKQEIIEQKKLNAQKRAAGGRADSSHQGGYAGKRATPQGKNNKPGFLIKGGIMLGVLAAALAIMIGVFTFVLNSDDSIEKGYYKYNNTYMYYSDWTDDISDDGWIVYDKKKNRWDGVYDSPEGADELNKSKTAKKYFLGESWNSKMGCPNFLKSKDYQEIAHRNTVDHGYYKYDDVVYYHDDSDSHSGWYSYDFGEKNWSEVKSDDIPSNLTDYDEAKDFYFTPDWDSDTQLTDFRDTEIYAQRHADDNDSYDDSWDNDDDDSSYDWDSGSDSWDSDSSDWDSEW